MCMSFIILWKIFFFWDGEEQQGLGPSLYMRWCGTATFGTFAILHSAISVYCSQCTFCIVGSALTHQMPSITFDVRHHQDINMYIISDIIYIVFQTGAHIYIYGVDESQVWKSALYSPWERAECCIQEQNNRHTVLCCYSEFHAFWQSVVAWKLPKGMKLWVAI